MKKIVVTVAAAILASYQAYALADACATHYGSDAPFYRVWDDGGDSQGHDGTITCYYKTSDGEYRWYTAAKKGVYTSPEWVRSAGGSSFMCEVSAEKCTFIGQPPSR